MDYFFHGILNSNLLHIFLITHLSDADMMFYEASVHHSERVTDNTLHSSTEH